MTDQFTRQTQEFFEATKDARIPENVQAMAEDAVEKSRDAFDKVSNATKDNAKAFEQLVNVAADGAKTIGEKVLRNTELNAEAAFDAAQAVARAKTLPEVARLQSSFLQQQMAVAGAQTKELFELSTKVAQQTFETVNAVTTKTFEQVKNAN
ncbi:MAG: phasin family protein [Alphaproteobacteria bacterium]|nr:phasin family protein [Alphaproteobacteria bacterium]